MQRHEDSILLGFMGSNADYFQDKFLSIADIKYKHALQSFQRISLFKNLFPKCGEINDTNKGGNFTIYNHNSTYNAANSKWIVGLSRKSD